MKIQTLKTLIDGRITTRKGTIVEVDGFKGRELIALGYAVHIPEPEDSIAAPIAFLSSEDVGQGADPFEVRPTGGPNGSARPASSSPEARARPKRTSRKRGAKPAS